MSAATVVRIADRPIWRTQKVRASDLAAGDVARDRYGKWDEVTKVKVSDQHYVTITFACNSASEIRKVALVDVQVVRPS